MPGALDRVNAALAETRGRAADGGQRSSVDQWISEYLLPSGMVDQFVFGGHAYGFGGAGGPNFTYGASKAREFSSDLPGHTAAVKACPPAFAAELVRALVLSQARFTFRNVRWSKTPRRMFGTQALALLERPWPNGTTGDLIARMEWHAGLAGNSFVTNWQQKARLRVIRPDWTAIVYGSQSEPDDPAGALDGEVLGYVYQNGGIRPGNQNQMVTLPVSSVAHWAPQPDPLNAGLGMSWITPAIREIQGDMLTSQHKITYFSNGATPNLVVKGIPAVTKAQFNEIVDAMEERHAGIANAYRTLYLTAGADATVVGSNMTELDFRGVQAGGETRIAMLSRVPAPVLQIAEGLAGSSLNAGNFSAARRLWGDSWIFPTLQNLASTLAPLVAVPGDAELWFDTADMPILREDAKDAAEIQQVNANTITTLVKDGFTPESAIAAVGAQDMSKLVHSGLVSVQLQPPRTDLQGAQTAQAEAMAAELLVRSGYTPDSARDAVTGHDLSVLEPGPLTSRYLVENPVLAGAEPGVPLGFPDGAGHPPAPGGTPGQPAAPGRSQAPGGEDGDDEAELDALLAEAEQMASDAALRFDKFHAPAGSPQGGQFTSGGGSGGSGSGGGTGKTSPAAHGGTGHGGSGGHGGHAAEKHRLEQQAAADRAEAARLEKQLKTMLHEMRLSVAAHKRAAAQAKAAVHHHAVKHHRKTAAHHRRRARSLHSRISALRTRIRSLRAQASELDAKAAKL